MTTGIVTWRFLSLDPQTKRFTSDPLAGFLPPNVNPPEGDGSVVFTVMPKESLPTGTVMANKASIVFDVKWQERTANTSAIFTGEDGKTYVFYSVARDLVGNIEDTPLSGDTATRVSINNQERGLLNDFSGCHCFKIYRALISCQFVHNIMLFCV